VLSFSSNGALCELRAAIRVIQGPSSGKERSPGNKGPTSSLTQQSARHSLQHDGAYEKENMITT
jgi:hypothetical protein